MDELKSIFKAGTDTLSCKRVCGFLGWITILVCYAYCCFAGKELPQMGELIAGCVALLGIDKFASIFNREGNS